MNELTIDHVAAIMPNAKANGLDDEWPHFLKTCRDYEINTKNRIAAFLMNVAKESGELYYVEEIVDGWDYEGREDLGNTQKGDGPRYKGHGYIQTTGRLNHRKVGEALGIDAEGDPTILTKMPWAWYSAGWYWRHGSSWGDLNQYADAGDFRATIVGVRGGADPDREHYWWTAMAVLPDDMTLPGAEKTVEEVAALAVESEWPQIEASADASGWCYIKQDDKILWLRFPPDGKTHQIEVEERGWVRLPSGAWVPELPKPEPPSTWDWPEANDPVGALGDGSYIDVHPTRYNWIPEVEEVARYLVDTYGIWVCTYVDHPPSYGLDGVSLDAWAWQGRGVPIDFEAGDAAFKDIFNNGKPPWINWCIWQDWIWVDGVGWYEYPDKDPWSDGPHRNHFHITFHHPS